MDLIDQLKILASKAISQREHLVTEEATKMALVIPFIIDVLGYDAHNPSEVVPEYVADIGTKKGEKVDYAIMKGGEPTIIFECKVAKSDLENKSHLDQLFRYFGSTKVRIGVLTNGIKYYFYSDLEEKNRMDDKPFLVLDLMSLEHAPISEFKKLTKSAFNIDEMLPAARDLKFTHEIKKLLSQEINNPSPKFVKFFAKQVYSGKCTQSICEQFQKLTQKAFNQLITETINARLESAKTLEESSSSQVLEQESLEETLEDDGIVTTEEELQGYHIIRAILARVTDPGRITYKDTKSYFNILLENNSWKQICRLYLNSKNVKRLGLFDQGAEYKVDIESINELYQYTEQIEKTLIAYDLA